jgi:hypothetical protein
VNHCQPADGAAVSGGRIENAPLQMQAERRIAVLSSIRLAPIPLRPSGCYT